MANKGRTRHLWLSAELDWLKPNYLCLSKPEIIVALPRHPYDSILKKARDLGLYASPYKLHMPPLPPLKLSDLDKGYIAGIIDGEGSIGLLPRRQRTYYCGNRRKTYSGESSPYPSLQISNTYLPALQRVKELLNNWGNIHRYPKANRKNLFVYRIGGTRRIEAILKAIGPYLIIKRQQADLVLSYIELYSHAEASIIKEAEMVAKMHELNQRGVGDNRLT